MRSELSNLAIALGIIIAGLVMSWIIGFLIRQLTRRYLTRTATQLDNVVIASIDLPIRIAVVVLAIQVAITYVDRIPENWSDAIDGMFFVTYLLLVYIALYRLIGGFARWYADSVVAVTETELDDKFLSFFRALAYLILTVITVIIFLGHFGIEPSALVTTLGIGTLAVALAAQETLSDMISGFMIMIDRPFTVGDRIQILDIDTWGDVSEIGLRSTRIRTRDNRLVSIPNSVIGKGLVVNYSDPSTVYRVQTHVGVSYGTDIDRARQVMLEAIQSEDWVMQDRGIEALMLEFGNSAMIFRVRCWIEHYVETRRIIDKMNTALYKALRKAQIDIEPLSSIRLYQDKLRPEAISASETSPEGEP